MFTLKIISTMFNRQLFFLLFFISKLCNKDFIFTLEQKWNHIFVFFYEGTIYQPLRSGRIWHKGNL